jgi:N4-gp56 family major capsid protein
MGTFATGTGATSLMTSWINREFIKTLENELQMQKFTTKAVIPNHMGKVGSFNVFPNPPGTSGSLTEGTLSEHEVTMTTTAALVTIAEYGEWMPVPTLTDLAAVEGTRGELAKRFAYGAALSIDTQVRASATGSTLTWFALNVGQGLATMPATTGVISATVLIAASKQLRANSVRGFTGIEGHPEGHLAAIMSPQAELDMITEATTGRAVWQNMVVNVPGPQGQGKAINGFMGSVYGTACYRSQNVASFTITNSALSVNFVLGDGGIAALGLGQIGPQVYINTPSEGDIGNPFRNRYTIAWHANFGSALGPDGYLRVVKMYSAGI